MRNKKLRIITLYSLAFLLGFPLAASANGRRSPGARPGVGTVVVRGYYSHPYWPGWGWGWGDPFWGYGAYPYYVDTRGTVKIEDGMKSDQVFVNNALAGTVDHARNLKLEPGSYNIKVMRNGIALVNQDVYVIADRKIEISVAGNSGNPSQ